MTFKSNGKHKKRIIRLLVPDQVSPIAQLNHDLIPRLYILQKVSK